MNKLFIYTFAIFLLQGCSNETKLTEEDAILFLDEMEEFNSEEGPVASSAYWISSNFITYDSQKVVADYSSDIASCLLRMQEGQLNLIMWM